MITDRELHRGITTVKGIWFALFASLILYVIIAPLVFDSAELSFTQESYQTLRMSLYGFAVFTLIVTWLLRRYLLSAPPAKKPTNSQQHPAVARYLMVMMISMGMSEAIGVYGLVLYVLGKNSQDLYLLTLISAAAMMLYYPKKEEILALADRFASGKSRRST
jgi:cytochrome b561